MALIMVEFFWVIEMATLEKYKKADEELNKRWK